MPTIIPDIPEVSIYTLQYRTSVIPGSGTTEERESKNGDTPDVIVYHRYLRNRENGIRLKNIQDNKTHDILIVPYFLEQHNIFVNERFTIRFTDTLTGDISRINTILNAGDKVFVNDEYTTIQTISDSSITFEDRLTVFDKSIFTVIPAIEIINTIEPETQSYPSEAYEIEISGKAISYKKRLEGEMNFNVLDSLPIFDKIPYLATPTQAVEYNRNQAVIDYDVGGAFEVATLKDSSDRGEELFFMTQDQNEWRQYKGILNFAQGRYNSFLYFPQTSDYVFSSFGIDRSEVIIQDKDGIIADNFIPGQRLAFRMPSGSVLYGRSTLITKIIGNDLSVNASIIDLESEVLGVEIPIGISRGSVTRFNDDSISITYKAGRYDIVLLFTSITDPESEVRKIITTGRSHDAGHSLGFS